MQVSDNMDIEIEEEDEHVHKKSKKDGEEGDNLDERDFTAELEEKDRRISMLQTTLQVHLIQYNVGETLFNDSSCFRVCNKSCWKHRRRMERFLTFSIGEKISNQK